MVTSADSASDPYKTSTAITMCTHDTAAIAGDTQSGSVEQKGGIDNLKKTIPKDLYLINFWKVFCNS